MVEAAKRGGHFEILRWLHSENIPSVDEMSETHDIIGEAAAHGNTDMVEWMVLVGYHPSACEIPYASHSNDVCFLEWLLGKECILDPEALDHCENTDTSVLDWLASSKGFLLTYNSIFMSSYKQGEPKWHRGCTASSTLPKYYG